MKHGIVFYTCRTAFDENAIRLMFKTEYFTYEKKLLLMRGVFAAVLLIAGMLTSLPIGARILCMLVGVWLLVAMDFPSKVRAEGVIQRRGGAASQVNLTFADTEFGPPPAPLMQLLKTRGLAPTIICESAGTQAEDAAALKKLYEQG